VTKKKSELSRGLDEFKKHIEKCRKLVAQVKLLSRDIDAQTVRSHKLMKKVPKEGFSKLVKKPGISLK
jgi:hypothetical protein